MARKPLVVAGLGIGCAIVIGALAYAVDWWRTRPVDLATITTAQWREDLRYLERELAARHANAFHRISRRDYEDLADKIDAAIPTLAPRDVPVYLSKLSASVGDAHTYLELPGKQGSYPFHVYYFGDVPRVISAAPEFKGLLGKRLVKIGSYEMSEVEKRLREILTQGENDWYYRAHYPWFLTAEVLHALGVVGDDGKAAFVFSDDGGTESVELGPEQFASQAWVHAYAKPSLFIEHENEDFWFTPMPDGRTVYLIFNGYAGLEEHARTLFAYIDSHAVQRLIIDMRNNGGGDYLKGHRYLIAPLLQRAALNRKGRLYVITGRNTFSAAMNNAVQFHTETQATLVGEPPGEVPNSYQERRDFRLPNSHLRVNYSVEFYKFLPGDSPALMPDIDAEPDWTDYAQGRDPALEKIMALPLDPGAAL
ncbi:MAG TPA: hypothetical protein VLV87_12100 [Gammaproteobacteria bacterium]|nr:hypothetical protein [Gammaproteobacteria bacterium]